MAEKRANLEMIAPTVDEAIANGLAELGLPREAVEIEILDEGNRGLFGLGSRHARVRLVVKNAPETVSQPKVESTPAAEPAPIALPVEKISPKAEKKSPPANESELVEELTLHITRETVTELLEHMGVEAEISVNYGEPDERQSRPPVLVDINGQELADLIGKRAETLTALQYIVSLIVSKKLGHNATVVIDVEKYRERRETQVRTLARRMADQAIKTGRKQVLEPMPAAERRIVHMELRENPLVTTASIGDEPYRKVTISPSKE